MALVEFQNNQAPYLNAENLNNNFNELNNKFNYSTTETIIGKWIDNKPIYRAIYQGTIRNGDTIFSNVDAIINISGYGFLDDLNYHTYKAILNGIAADAPDTLFSSFFAINNTIEFYAKYGGTNSAAYNCIIVLEYTKTTD